MQIETLMDLAREAGKHGKTTDAMERWAVNYIRNHLAVFDVLMPDIMHRALRDSLHALRSRNRQQAKAVVSNGRGVAGMAAVAEVARETLSLMERWTVGDKQFGCLTYEELHVWVATQTNRGLGYLTNAKFGEMLLKKMARGKTVADCIKTGEFEQMYAETIAQMEKKSKSA